MAGLDLRDFRVFDEIYRTRNVSRAAERVGLSQPSLSIRLGRLRRHFGDALFVRTSAGMQPTPHADAMIGAVRQALGLFAAPRPVAFDPRVSDRPFRIAMTDIGQIVILPRLLDRLRVAVPGAPVEVANLGADTPRLLESGECDLAMGFTRRIPSGFYQQKLFDEHFVCMVSRRHPRIGARLARKQFLEEWHVAVTTAGTGHAILDRALEQGGLARRVALRVPSFLGLAQIVAETEFVAILPWHLARILAADAKVKLVPAPLRLPSYAVKQYWHGRFHGDPGNKWLRGTVAELFAE